MRLHIIKHIVSLWLVLSLTIIPQTSYAKSADESRLKATFVSKFIAYVKWPEPKSIKNKPGEIINICVLGRDDNNVVAGVLKTATLKAKGQRTYKLIEKHNWAGVGVDCHILYIGAGQKKNLPQLLSDLKDQPVLTVSDIGGFSEMGGIIEFAIVSKKLKVGYVNVKTAKRAGVNIKSALLEVALNVIR